MSSTSDATNTNDQACSLAFFDTIVEKAEAIAQATFEAVMKAELADNHLSAHKLEPNKLKYLGKRMTRYEPEVTKPNQPEVKQEQKKQRLYRICFLPTFETQNKSSKEQEFETCPEDCAMRGHKHITSEVAEKIINNY
jgi:hypothetical protein